MRTKINFVLIALSMCAVVFAEPSMKKPKVMVVPEEAFCINAGMYKLNHNGEKIADYKKAMQNNEQLNANDLAASFQDAVVDVLVSKTKRAIQEYNCKQVIVAGGVAANKGLRNSMQQMVNQLEGVTLTFPPFEYCTDNAAMIGVAAYFQINNK